MTVFIVKIISMNVYRSSLLLLISVFMVLVMMVLLVLLVLVILDIQDLFAMRILTIVPPFLVLMEFALTVLHHIHVFVHQVIRAVIVISTLMNAAPARANI